MLCCVSCVEYVDLYAEETQGSHTFTVLISQTAEQPQVTSMLEVGF